MTVEQVIQTLFSMPVEDQRIVAAALEQRLSASEDEHLGQPIPEDSSAAVSGEDFLKELQRRSAAFRDGTMSSRPAAEAIAELRQKLASRVK